MKLIFLPLVLATALAFAQTPSLTVTDQAASGYTLTLGSATLAQDGFVVVHATDAEGTMVLTPPLGLTYLRAGSHEDVTVDLDPGLLAEYGYGPGAMGGATNMNARTVAPMLHIDDGDMVYEFPDGPDTPVAVDGQVVVATLALTLPPALRTFAQTAAGGTVTIDAVTADQAGFVVVHALDLDGNAVLTPPLGLAPVAAGVTRYLTIDLDPGLLAEYGYDAGPKAIVPMLHIDDGNGVYEFPDGPDTPVVVAGGPLVSPLELGVAEMGAAAIAVSGMETLDVGADGLSVTLPSVTLSQPGFVVLHASDTNGDMVGLPVLGVSDLLGAGSHDDVVVTIAEDQTPKVGDVAFAMAHVDDGNGVYEFPTSDAPFVQDGAVLVVPLTFR